MPRRSQIALAKPAILRYFDESPKKVYSSNELTQILQSKHFDWRLALYTTRNEFISFLQTEGRLREQIFRSQIYNRKIVRYSWGEASIYEETQALYPRGYLSHASALIIHRLIDVESKTLYLNVEQSPKPASRTPLVQKQIDQAFSRKQRHSNLVYKHFNWSVTILNGKNTNNLDVREIAGLKGERLRVTSLERTLIDAVVRPAYAGGITQLMEAYTRAKDLFSIDQLLYLLRTLAYVYPYHQSIGFLMQRTGYLKAHLAQLQELGIEIDFYLLHGMKNPAYDPSWRLFYPKTLS